MVEEGDMKKPFFMRIRGSGRLLIAKDSKSNEYLKLREEMAGSLK